MTTPTSSLSSKEVWYVYGRSKDDLCYQQANPDLVMEWAHVEMQAGNSICIAKRTIVTEVSEEILMEG